MIYVQFMFVKSLYVLTITHTLKYGHGSCGESKIIPLEKLYSLAEGQQFIQASSIPYQEGKGYFVYSEKFGRNVNLVDPLDIKKHVLLSTGKWSDVEIVDELNVLTGEPTGHKGFVVTKKEEPTTKHREI